MIQMKGKATQILNRLNETFYHIDSIKRLNKKHAVNLAQNVAPGYQIVKTDTLQQSDSLECGLHVIVNINILLNKLNVYNLDSFNQCVNRNKKKLTENSLNYIVKIKITSQTLFTFALKMKRQNLQMETIKKVNTLKNVQ